MPIGIDDLYFVIFLLIAGVAAGYVGGLFGIGGGTLLVPIFLTIFPYFHTAHTVVMHVAVGTSLALLIPNTAMSAYKQYKAGNIDFTLLKRWMPFIVIGAVIGVSIIKFIPTLYLKIIFACYLYASFAFVAFKKERETDVEGAPHGITMGVVGTLIGGFSVLLGSGGGTFSVPFMKLYHYPMKRAIAFASATGIFIGLIGTIGVIIAGWDVAGRTPYSLGFVNILGFVIMLPTILWSSPRGVNLANRLPKRKLQWIFAAFLLTVAVYMTYLVFRSY